MHDECPRKSRTNPALLVFLTKTLSSGYMQCSIVRDFTPLFELFPGKVNYLYLRIFCLLETKTNIFLSMFLMKTV